MIHFMVLGYFYSNAHLSGSQERNANLWSLIRHLQAEKQCLSYLRHTPVYHLLFCGTRIHLYLKTMLRQKEI